MPKNVINRFNDPVEKKRAVNLIEKRIAEIKQDKSLFNKKESYSVEFELEGLPLVQLKFVEVIFKELLEHEDDDIFKYLIHMGLEYEMMKLGIARQALMANTANMMGVDLSEADRII